MPLDVNTHIALKLDQHAPDPVNGRSNSEIQHALAVPEDTQYNPCAEAHPGDDVPRGAVQSILAWQDSRIYPNTKRDIWIYTPPGYQAGKGERPALAVFQDGAAYLNREGPVRAPAVFDSLIAEGSFPPIVGVFVNPGTPNDESIPQNSHRHDLGRSYEYDAVTPKFAEFITREILPLTEEAIGAQLTRNPAQRMICGISSGGICAFNAAWHAPEAFGLVLSHCGSFTNIRGGHNIPYLIRTTERKPLKVFLQSGERDAHILLGSWPLANQDMASALEFAGYEHRFEFGEGGHSLRHGGAIFADSLRWLFG